jgi:L-lactate utilization protein LutB
MATATILNLFNPPTAATHYSGYSFKVSWSLMKGIQNYFKSPLFCFHGNCGKVCPTDSDFFDLSRSTRCGCCSYQVSSISVQRVTCYDHFCVFQFFSILAVSMATAAILKKSTLNSTTSHGIWYSYKVS